MQSPKATSFADDLATVAPPPRSGGSFADDLARLDPNFKTTNEPPSPSLWERANTSPFHKEIQAASHAIADYMSQPRLGDAELNDKIHGLGTLSATIRGGGAGIVEGLGDAAELFTTPVGIALMLAGLGGEGAVASKIPALKSILQLSAVRRLQRATQTLAGAAFATHGAGEVVSAPTAAGKAQGVVEMATGALGMAGSVTGYKDAWTARRRTAQGAEASHSFKQAAPPTKSAPYTDEQMHAARPYLEEAHGTTPIGSLADALAAADTQIGRIEGLVSAEIQRNPSALIQTNPLAAVARRLAPSVRRDALVAGLAELRTLGLDRPLTLERADAIRKQLNAENKGVLQRNRYDVATARQVDPGFAAREVAAQSLREGIYNQLDQQTGVGGGARQLRQDEGALIAVRNAIDRQIFNGEKKVAGSGSNSTTRQIVAIGVRALPVPALIADPVAHVVAGRAPMTRDDLMARAFKHSRAGAGAAPSSAPSSVPPTTGAPPPPPPAGPSGLRPPLGGIPPAGTPPAAPTGPSALGGQQGPLPLGPAPPEPVTAPQPAPKASKVRTPQAAAPMPPTVPPTAKTTKGRKPKASAAVETPAAAAAEVVNQIERVIDTSGAKSGAEVQRRVIDTLQRELEPASQAVGYKTIEYRAGRAYGGREGAVLVDGEPLASVDQHGTMKWLDTPSAYTTAQGKYVPAEKSKRPDIGFSGRDLTPTEHATRATDSVAVALSRDKGAGQLKVHIPGDGTFTIERNPHAIRATIKRIASAGTSVWQGVGDVKSVRPRVEPAIPKATW